MNSNKDAILAASLAMAKAFNRGNKMLVCGNGGSATDAQHVAVEFMHPITVGRKALPAICLANDMAMMTAVANDVGFADVFSRQIIALGCEGDVLLGISTSGNSENLIHAFDTARRINLITIGYAGDDGGRMRQLSERGLIDFLSDGSNFEHPPNPGNAHDALPYNVGRGSHVLAASFAA
ncbi:MAG TPA: SIS domain-containing protein [Blastocatellia bacterium]|nr:SIS domain-containing protein [Blastocatellia bacterium]